MSHASIRFHLMAASAACALLAACSAPEDSAIEPVSDSRAPAPVSHEDTRPADGVAPPETSPERNAVDIQEWDVQWEGRPRDPYTLDGETVWFVGQANSYIGRLDVATGEMTRTDLREGAGPHNLIVNPDGRIWYAGNRDAHIGIYDPADGTFDYVETPPDTVADPHTQIFDGNGNIWFTSQRSNSVSRLNMETRQLDTVMVPTPGARAYGIKLAPDGTIWVALFGTHKLASVDPQTMVLTEHDLPRDTARPRRLDITSDGRIWYGDYADGYLGVLDPADGSVTEWAMPSGANARPYALAVDGQDRVWFVETGVDPNWFVGFDPASETFFSVTGIPSGGGVVRHMHYLPATGEIWFGSDMGTIGRAQVE
ncbi:putative streptogramin lyase, gluconolactonase family [Maricaulis maris MCS10]|uniref:Putative streptogramin lyase, gluconolactonase family n=1 Tax=Maricaulis maris (strain MCS10) TaxID=394221 RepID=Q0AN56_MARMM|nr:streptogramin lyase gluconolactonase family [Maricaulis maris]ABI66281.1 putative streptogramin lyase, gluconolactonase family [Maricaulis maris MCS10]